MSVVLKRLKVISQWQVFFSKIEHGFFRVIGPKCAIKSHCDTQILIFSLLPFNSPPYQGQEENHGNQNNEQEIVSFDGAHWAGAAGLGQDDSVSQKLAILTCQITTEKNYSTLFSMIKSLGRNK